MVQQAVVVFLLDVHVEAGDLAVEGAFGDLELGRLVAHGAEQGVHLDLREGDDVVLKKERPDGHEGEQDDEGLHDAGQGDAGGFHGQELELLTEVAKRHQRGQQDGQRQGHGHEGEGGVKKHLGKDADTDALADHIVHVLPQELHEYDEKTNTEGHEEQR